MNLKEYKKIEEKYGAGSKEASEAYRDLMITDLKPISTETHIDEWGATIVTLKDRIELSAEGFLWWIDFFAKAEGASCAFKGNKIKIEVW